MASDLNLFFGTAVATRRAELGMSKQAVAQQMGIRGDMLGRLERGERQWKVGAMVCAAQALGTTVGALLGESGQLAPFDSALLGVLRTSGERAAIHLLLDRMQGISKHS